MWYRFPRYEKPASETMTAVSHCPANLAICCLLREHMVPLTPLPNRYELIVSMFAVVPSNSYSGKSDSD